MSNNTDRDSYLLKSTVREMNYYHGYYGQLIGAKVVGVKVSAHNDDEYGDLYQYEVWPSIIFEKDGVEYSCEISRDEEGNGPGFMFGLNSVRNSDEFLKEIDSLSVEQLTELIEILSKTIDKELNYMKDEV